MLELKNITKDYYVGEQTIHALKGINLTFRKSEFVSILGPSGCGKTTLMNIVGGLDRYTSGDMLVNGVSTASFADQDWDAHRNKRIGFVFQNYNLIPHLSVLGNVTLALTLSGISPQQRKERAIKALSDVGLANCLSQKPNQLSGGQMQRVAIARALVNNPEVLLADEPTGALDTATSEQIMQILHEISKSRLVIMVTHNSVIAHKYSTRLIEIVDGLITSDSMPYTMHEQERQGAQVNTRGKRGKVKNKGTSMTFWTALSLSWRNLITKRGRTVLTAIAGSIGIIGISLILALSGGMDKYIIKLQTDTLSSSPITISRTTFDLNQAMQAMGKIEALERFPSIKKIFVTKATQQSFMKENVITDQYYDYINTALDKSWYAGIYYSYGQTFNIYGTRAGQEGYDLLQNVGAVSGTSAGSGASSTWQLLLEEEFISTQYDLLEGKYPENQNEVVLIVDKTNSMPESKLAALGLVVKDDDTNEIDFEDALGKEYYFATNDYIYKQKVEESTEFFDKKGADKLDFENCTEEQAIKVRVVGILRVNQQTDMGVLREGAGLTKQLYNKMQELNEDSAIVQYMKDNRSQGKMTNPETGAEFASEAMWNNKFRSLGATSTPSEISIYSTSFEYKRLIKEKLDAFNADKTDEQAITYMDISELAGEALSTFVDTVSYVLIAFTGISLVVSSIMIGIITYVSVLERTKEIGILRSIGARKKDITRVFNAETVIIGLFAGIIGVVTTYLLTVPINALLETLVSVTNIAYLSPVYALIMVGISVVLTLVSGLIPAIKAANKDPVTALRTE